MDIEEKPPATVYWRPGCPFCSRLREDLRVLGLPTREINIWGDESAAATVRSIAHGNETVPAVVIGDKGLVNPSATRVLAEVRRLAPGFVPDQDLARAGRRLRRLRVLQWTVIIALVAVSFALDASGHSGLGWLADGVAVTVYLLFLVLLPDGVQ